MMLITAEHNGKIRTLTVPQWAKILNVTKKHLYNRKKYGHCDQSVIQGNYFQKEKKYTVNENDLKKYYDSFIFNRGLNNGV